MGGRRAPAGCIHARSRGDLGGFGQRTPASDVTSLRRSVPRRHLPSSARTDRPRVGSARTKGRRMSSVAADATETPAAGPEAREATTRSIPRRGWLVVATKEFGDHVSSMRFIVLLIVLGLAAVIPLYFASDQIRGLASQATGTPAIFLFLFTLGPQTIPFLRVDVFVSIVAPLLGIAFAFDAVNGERAAGTLPRLMSQPIYRDDVINGKFAAGLAAITLVLALVMVFIAG